MGVSEGRGVGTGVGITFDGDLAILIREGRNPKEVVTSIVDIEGG